MEKLVLLVENLSCPVCAEKIGTLLNKMKGIANADVFFATGKVKVSYDSNEISVGEIIKALDKLGYKSKVK